MTLQIQINHIIICPNIDLEYNEQVPQMEMALPQCLLMAVQRRSLNSHQQALEETRRVLGVTGMASQRGQYYQTQYFYGQN